MATTFNAADAVRNWAPEAFDIEEIGAFMARYKKPNSYAAEGHTVDARFFAKAFAAALVEELGDGWEVVDNDESFAELARLRRGKATMMVNTCGYGVNAYKKLEVGVFVRQDDNTTRNVAEIGISASKTLPKIATDIQRRAFANLGEAVDAAKAADKAQAEAEAALAKKCDQLSRKYVGIRFRVDGGSINTSTKYGGSASLTGARIYFSDFKNAWTLTSSSLVLDDIDSKQGRAMLKALSEA